MDDLRRERAVISLYLDRAYDPALAAKIMSSAKAFNSHVGGSWSLLIPYGHTGYAVDTEFSANEYGYDLSNAVIRRLGLSSGHLPAMVFEIEPNQSHFFLKLKSRPESEILEIIEDIGDICVQLHKEGPRDPVDLRQEASAQIAKYLFGRNVLSFVSGSVPVLARLLGIGSDAKNLVSA